MSTDELQPKPEAFLDLIRRQQRGRLKIYLGFAAGVGKTYDMLQEGNRLRQQGIDELRQVWRQAMEDKTPGVPVKDVLDRLERKYRALANAAKK